MIITPKIQHLKPRLVLKWLRDHREIDFGFINLANLSIVHAKTGAIGYTAGWGKPQRTWFLNVRSETAPDKGKVPTEKRLTPLRLGESYKIRCTGVWRFHDEYMKRAKIVFSVI